MKSIAFAFFFLSLTGCYQVQYEEELQNRNALEEELAQQKAVNRLLIDEISMMNTNFEAMKTRLDELEQGVKANYIKDVSNKTRQNFENYWDRRSFEFSYSATKPLQPVNPRTGLPFTPSTSIPIGPPGSMGGMSPVSDIDLSEFNRLVPSPVLTGDDAADYERLRGKRAPDHNKKN